MSIATLQDIIIKVRKLTGSGTSLQLTDSQIIDYINSFYLYDFPSQFRSLKLRDKYTFNTIRGIDTYMFDSEHFSTIEMPCYCAKREIKLFQDPWSFYGANFNWQYQQNLTEGDGTKDASGVGYSGTVQATPIIRSTSNNPMVQTVTPPIASGPTKPNYTVPPNPSRVQNILITTNVALGNTLNVTDDGNGNLIGDCTSGSINYETGLIASLAFTQNVPSGAHIVIQYNPATLAIPLAIMYYQNQFTLRPVPDKGYTIELMAYRLPSQAILGSTDPDSPNLTGEPELNEWWETLAFGAAKKVFEDRLDPDGVALMDKGLAERYALNMTRTYAQLGSQSMNTIFRDQLSYSYGNTGWGFGGQ